MDVRGTLPRPRVGLIGSWTEQERSALLLRFPTVYDWTERNAPDVDAAEVDLIIAKSPVGESTLSQRHVARHLILIGSDAHAVQRGLHWQSWQIRTGPECSSKAYKVPPLGPRLHTVREAAVRDVHDVRKWPTVQTPQTADHSGLMDGALLLSTVPDGKPLGVVYIRRTTETGLAFLPWSVPNPVAWIDAIVAEWAEADREAFQSILPWREQTDWLTPEERAIAAKLAALREERERVVSAYSDREDELAVALSAARAAGDRGIRRLLTEQDEALVDALVVALRSIGFHVQRMDPEVQPGTPKREDLRVTTPDAPGWEAVVEVKGMQKSGGTADHLRKLARHVLRYQMETGRAPSAQWLILNGQFAMPPEIRQRPFEASPDIIDEFGREDGGLIIGTVDLFRALTDPGLSGTELRARLVATRGRFEWPVSGGRA
jgi:hypothetical protein